MTAKEKAYSRACDALVQWAAGAPSDALGRPAEGLAKSYGILPAAATTIIRNELRKRGR